MNERERLLSVLRGERREKTPWFADLSYLYFSLNEQGFLKEEYKGDAGYLKFYTDLGAGICFYPPFLWKTAYTGDVVYNQTVSGSFRTSFYDTPAGSIRSVEKFSQSNFSWAYTEHFVKTIEDLRVMLYVHENSVFSENYEEFEKIDRLWGGYGIPTGIAPVSVAPIQKLLARWAGVENTINLYMDHMEEFEEIMQRIESSEDKIFDIICASKADYVEFPENLSSEITGKNFFLRYNKPYYQRRIEALHKAGKYAGIHIDGTLKTCLPLLHECGFDVAEAVTPMPSGDMRPEELREAAGEGIVIWGGLPGGLFTPAFSDAEFDAYVKRILHVFQNDGRFVLGVADQVPPDGLLERVARVREFVEGSCF